MGNLGGGEILVILLVALIVLGPAKLPPAVRQVGKIVGEIRRIGEGFQQELQEASRPLQDATADLRAAEKNLLETARKPIEEMAATLKAADPNKLNEPAPAGDDVEKDADSAPCSGGETSSTDAPGPVSRDDAEATAGPPHVSGSDNAGEAALGPAASGRDDVESGAAEPETGGTPG